MLFKEYLLQNWPLLLVLVAFIISLFLTVFSDKKTVKYMVFLIASIFALSIVVFIEFAIKAKPEYKMLRLVMMAIRYSATPFIIAEVIYINIKKLKSFIFIPALLLLILDIVSIFTGIVFRVDDAGQFSRGPLGVTPFVMVGLYSAILIYLLIERSNKSVMEIVPIVFLGLSLGSGLVLPFILKESYSSIFCLTIAIALFSYNEFTIHELTKKDALTGLLNRQAYYADVSRDPKKISAIISLDMNGLKAINDNIGHKAGDEALVSLSLCFIRAVKYHQHGYRVGGDEFVIVCRKSSEDDVQMLVERIKKLVRETKYSCSIGYSMNKDGNKTVTEMLKESDEMMYKDKERYYLEIGKDRRKI